MGLIGSFEKSFLNSGLFGIVGHITYTSEGGLTLGKAKNAFGVQYEGLVDRYIDNCNKMRKSLFATPIDFFSMDNEGIHLFGKNQNSFTRAKNELLDYLF